MDHWGNDTGKAIRIDHVARVTPRDRLLVEWVAQAKVGDELPPPWSYSRTPLYSVVRTLMLIGVIGKPDPDTPLATGGTRGLRRRARLARGQPARAARGRAAVAA